MAKTIADFKSDYEVAREKGNFEGMRLANLGANAIRQKSGVMPEYSSLQGDKQFIENLAKKAGTSTTNLVARSAIENSTARKLNALQTVKEQTETKEKGVNVKTDRGTVQSVAPENGSKVRDYMDKRNEMAGTTNGPAISINLNKLQSKNLDTTAKQTILAKNSAAAKQPTLPERIGKATLAGLDTAYSDTLYGTKLSADLINKYGSKIEQNPVLSVLSKIPGANNILNSVKTSSDILGVADMVSKKLTSTENSKGKTVADVAGNIGSFYDDKAAGFRSDYQSGLKDKSVGKWALGGVEMVSAMAPTLAMALLSGGGSTIESLGGKVGKAGVTATLADETPSIVKGVTQQTVKEYASNFKSMSPFMVQAAGGYAKQAEIEGYSQEQQLAFGIAGGLAEGVTEALSFGPLKQALGFASNSVKPIAKNGVMNTVKYFGLKGIEWLNSAMANVMEEIAVNPIVGVAEKTILDQDKPLFGDNGIFSSKESLESASGALAMSTILTALGLPMNTASFIRATKYVENEKLPTKSETKEILKVIEKDISENIDIVNESKNTTLFTDLALDADYSEGGVAQLNKAVQDVLASAASTLSGTQEYDGDAISSLEYTKNILDDAISNDYITTNSKPTYKAISSKIGSLLEGLSAKEQAKISEQVIEPQTIPTNTNIQQTVESADIETPMAESSITEVEPTTEIEPEEIIPQTEPTKEPIVTQVNTEEATPSIDNSTLKRESVETEAKKKDNAIKAQSYAETQKLMDALDAELISKYGEKEWLNAATGRETIIPKDQIEKMDSLQEHRDGFEAKENNELVSGILDRLTFDTTDEWVSPKVAVENILRKNLELSKLFNATGSGENVVTKESLYNQLIQSTGAPHELWGEYNWAKQIADGQADSPFGKSLKPLIEQINSIYNAILGSVAPKEETPTELKGEVTKPVKSEDDIIPKDVIGYEFEAQKGTKDTVLKQESMKKPAKEETIDEQEKGIETSPNKVDNEGEKVPAELMKQVFGIIGEKTLSDKNEKKSVESAVVDAYNSEDIDYSYDRLLKAIGDISVTDEISKDAKELIATIRNAKIKITDDLRKSIADFNSFRKSNLANVRLTNDGLPVDVFYSELCETYPGYFSEEVTHPTDQLELIVATVKNLKKKDTFKLSDVFNILDITDTYIVPILEVINKYKGGIASERGREENNKEVKPSGRNEGKAAKSDTTGNQKAGSGKGKVEELNEGGIANETNVQGIGGRIPKGTESEVLQGAKGEGGTGKLPKQDERMGDSDSQRHEKRPDGQGEGKDGLSEGVSATDTTAEPSGDAGGRDSKADVRATSEGYRITDANLDKGTKVNRYHDNVKAINLVQVLEEEGRKATAEEMKVLAKYSGWGGLQEPFVYNKDATWQERAEEVKNLLTKEQYRAAASSTDTAFYTPITVINSMYDILKNIGIKNHSNILEPSCGTGYFLGCMPNNIRQSSTITGIEIDDITGKIARYLYPNADIKIQGFENLNVEKGSLDLVIGNVPFDRKAPYDKNYKQYIAYQIHDYFILKGLDSLKDGGIMAVITTSGTLDKKGTAVRKQMENKANLVAAIRLPKGTFNATGVVSDLLIFQKKGEGVEDFGNNFLDTKEMDFGGKGNELPINEYFVKHPEMVLGNIEEATNRFGELALTVKKNGRTIEDVIDNIPKNIIPKAIQVATEQIQSEVSYGSLEPDVDESDQTFTFKDGKIYKKNGITGQHEEWYKVYGSGDKKGQKELIPTDGAQAKRLRGMVDLYDKFKKVIDIQANTEDEKPLIAAQKELNKAYDEYVKKYKAINDTSNKSVMKDDNRYLHLCSAEEKDYANGGMEWAKGLVFEKRVIPIDKPITHVENAEDALVVSLNIASGVNLEYMSELYGKDKETIVKELGDKIYETTDGNGVYVLAEEYLSGNVRQKLKDAKEKASTDNRFKRNVEALEKVQPIDLSADEISVELGAPWIGTKYMSEFAKSLFDGNAEFETIYNKYESSWVFRAKSYTAAANSANIKWGSAGYGAMELLSAIVNKKTIQVKYKVDDREYVDREKTDMAISKATEIKEYFKDWIFQDVDRRTHLVDYYNENKNNLVSRKHDGSYLKMPGISPDVSMRKHQANGIARALSPKNVIFVHPVGSGKTYTMIGAAQELKRLKLARKPLMVVPNNKVTDFMQDYYKMYPNAKILAIKDDDFSPINRKKLLARIKNTDFDCVIMRHSSFDMFPFSPEYETRYIQKQIDELEEAILEANNHKLAKKDLKSMNKALETLQKRLDALTDARRENSDIYFDTCGIDALILDEAHNYKNLSFPTKMGRIAGVQNSGCKKSTHMHMATELLNNRKDKVIFATATPISNSIGELYTMMRYLEPNVLKDYDISSFDAWASEYGKVMSEPEMNTTGSGLTSKERFSKFKNVPELIKMFKIVADIVQKEELDIKLPDSETLHVKVESTDILQEYNHYLEAYKKRMTHEEAKHAGHLMVMQDARHASLDLRCVRKLLIERGLIDRNTTDADLDFPDSKINTAVDKIFGEYKNSTDFKGTQVVFLDRGTPTKYTQKEIDELNKLKEIPEDDRTEKQIARIEDIENAGRYGFDLYADIKKKLIAKGIKPEEIAFIQENKSDSKKEKLFDKVNAGQMRILIGSTAMMGEGMNVQKRAVALHQIDAPMRPSDVEQREGRVLRQGNDGNPTGKVSLYHYSTLNSYDAPTWEMLSRKNQGVNQMMSGDESVREIDDLSFDPFANMSVEAANNPLMFERKDVSDELHGLEIKKKNFQRTLYLNQNVVKYYPTQVADIKERMARYVAAQSKVDKAAKDDFIVEGKKYETMKEASAELLKLIVKTTGYKNVELDASIRGLNISLEKRMDGQHLLSMEGLDSITVATAEAGAFIQRVHNPETSFLRLNNIVNRIPSIINEYETDLKDLKTQKEQAEKSVNDKFQHDAKIVELKQKLTELDNKLKGIDKEQQPAPSKQNQSREENDADTYQYSKSNGSTPTSAPSKARFAGQIFEEQGKVTGKTEAIFEGVPKGYKAKTPNQIKAFVMTKFKVNAYTKNFRRPKNVLAYFKPAHSVISMRYHEAIGPLAHELGHKLDKEYDFTSNQATKRMLQNAPGYNKELTQRGYKDEQKRAEVTADFIMLYLTNPNAAYELGSYADGENFYDTFENMLSKQDLKNIRELQRDILMWGADDSISKALKTIVYRGNGEFTSFKHKVDTFMRSFIDGFDGAKAFIDAINKESGKKVNDLNSTYEMLRKTLTAPSITSAILTDNLINPQGFAVGESLGSILKGVKQINMPLFDLYLKDVQALDWMKSGKRVYSIEMDSEEEIRGRIAKMESEHPEFKETAEKVYAWWKEFTDMWLVGTGLKTQEFMNTIHEMYPHYVPNFRKLDGIKGKNKNVSGDPIKRAKGSDLPTYSATESLILQVGNIVKAGIHNQAVSTLHALYSNKEFSETVGLFFDRIPPDVQVNKFDATGIKAALSDQFFAEAYSEMSDGEKEEFESLPIKEQLTKASELSNSQVIDNVIADSVTYYTPKKSSSDPNVAVCFINGKPKFYNITDENLANAFMALEPKQIGGMIRFVKALTRGFTGLTTANNPLFVIANHARDIQHGLVMTESKYNALNPMTYLSYVKDLLGAYGQIVSHTGVAKKIGVKESKNYSLYRANAGLESKYMPSGDQFNRTMRAINGVKSVHKKTKAGNAIYTTKNVLASAMELINSFNGVVEAAPRMVAFNRAYSKYGKTPEALTKAIHAAKEATVDFQRRGTITANLSAAVPFIGASIAGIDQFRRITMTKEAWTTKEGQQRLLRAVITQAIPAIIMALIYDGDDDFEKLQDYIKDGYWLFKYDDDKFIKMPKEREISAIFGTPFQRGVTKYLQPDLDNKEETASYLNYLLQTFTPAHDVTGWALFEAINNKTWYGGTVVSQRDEDLMQPGYYDEIYDDTTSNIAKFLAKHLPDVKSLGALNTPKGLEYAIDQLTGGLGDVILPATTKTNNGMSNELLRRYMTDSVYSNKYSSEAYDILDELNAAVMYGKRTNTSDEKTEAWQKAFSNTMSSQSDKFVDVSDYFAQIRDNNNNQDLTIEEREALNRESRININRITEEIVKAYKSGNLPSYSLADVAMDEGAKQLGITEEQYKEVIRTTTGEDTAIQKYSIATMSDLSAEQKSYLSETILKNKSYDEWGEAFTQLERTGLSSKDVSELYTRLGNSDTPSKIKQFNLANDAALTADQKALAATALLGNDKYNEWGAMYVSLKENGVNTEDFAMIDKAVSSAGEGDQYTRVLKSGEHKGEQRTEAIPSGSKYDTGTEGHKSASRKKMEAIKAAYPDASQGTLELLYSLYDVSEKLY